MENSHTKSNQYGGVLKWWYPQMDGLQWKTQFQWMIKRYPHDSGNLHIPSDMCVCACICFCDLTVSKSLPFRFTVCEPILRTLWYPNVCVCVKMAMKKSGIVQSGCKGGMPIVDNIKITPKTKLLWWFLHKNEFLAKLLGSIKPKEFGVSYWNQISPRGADLSQTPVHCGLRWMRHSL
jgi:hypothetical protein